jgi:anti-sigma B factor antagonist
MKISKVKRGSVCVVIPHVKKIDASIAVEFKKKMIEIVKSGENRLVLNLQEVDFIDSSGLGALVSVYKSAGPNGAIKLFHVKDSVRSIFELTRLDRVFGIHVSEEGAVESLE